MLIAVIVLSCTTVFFFLFALFCGTELLKKFTYMRKFVDRSGQLLTYSLKEDRSRDRKMRTIVFQAEGPQPFTILVGFRFPYGERWDWYGYVEAKDGRAAISTFIGKGGCEFQFLIGGAHPNQIVVFMADEGADQAIDATYPPHFFQRLGMFA